MNDKRPDLLTSFMNGAKKGGSLVFGTVIPSTVFAFTITKILTMSGLLDILGKILSPVMALFGLPGEAAMPLVLCISSPSGACASAASMVGSGIMSPEQATIMLPAFFLMGAMILYTGRILGVTVESKEYKVCYAIAVINALLSMIVMRVLVALL